MSPELHDTIAAAVLDGVSDAVVASDREGTIVFWNPGAERIFGHTAEEALGQSLDLIVPERLRKRHWQGFRRVMETGKSRYGAGDVLAVPGERKDGSRLSLEFTIAPLAGEAGRLEGLVAVMRDVTARFEETSALKRQLAAGS